MIAHESAHLTQDNNVKFGIISAEKADIDSEFLVYAKKSMEII